MSPSADASVSQREEADETKQRQLLRVLRFLTTMRELRSIDDLIFALRTVTCNDAFSIPELETYAMATTFAERQTSEVLDSTLTYKPGWFFEAHLADMQRWMHQGSYFPQHADWHRKSHLQCDPQSQTPVQKLTWRQTVEREVETCVLVLEADMVVENTKQTAQPSHEASIVDILSQSDSHVWWARVHVNATEALLHVPFVLRLVEFFLRPLQQRCATATQACTAPTRACDGPADYPLITR